MTDHLKTLRDLMAAGEKAVAGPCEHAILGSLKDRGHMGMTEYSEYVKLCLTTSGEETGETKIHYVRVEKPDGPADVAHLGNGPTSAGSAAFFAAAANARPALAALLRVVDAAKAASVACKLACDAKGADKAVDGWYQAQAVLDAALRDLAPEVEDGE